MTWAVLVAALALASRAAAAPLVPPDVDRRVHVAAGVGHQWGVGGSAAAWGDSFTQRFELSGEAGRRARTAIGFALVHARPTLVDTRALIPEPGVPAGAASGVRDELSCLFSVRVPLHVGAILPAESPILEVLPTFGFTAGMLATDAHLVVAGYDAAVPVRSRTLAPVLGARIGAELRLWDWLAVLPHGELLATLAADAREVGSGQTWEAEARLMIGADLAVRF